MYLIVIKLDIYLKMIFYLVMESFKCVYNNLDMWINFYNWKCYEIYSVFD